jgi:hypothetical protein
MVLGGTPGIVERILTVEKMGKKGAEWANMLRDELAWQDDVEQHEEAEQEEQGQAPSKGGQAPKPGTGEAPKPENAMADAAGDEVEQTRDKVGNDSLADPETIVREEALRKQRADSLKTAAEHAVADDDDDGAADGAEEGVPNVDATPSPEPEPEPKPKAGNATSRWKKAGVKVQDQVSQKDAEALRDLLKRLEEFDQVCGKVRAATDKPTAMKYAARRRELCKELAKPCADVLDVQESNYAAMHARLQRIAASLQKLEMKAAELVNSQDGDNDREGAQLAVVGRALTEDPTATTVAQQELQEAQAALAHAELTGDPAEVTIPRGTPHTYPLHSSHTHSLCAFVPFLNHLLHPCSVGMDLQRAGLF